MYYYETDVITTGGDLNIKAQETDSGSVVAVFTDLTGKWEREFIDVAEFQKEIKNLHIVSRIRVSEGYQPKR